MTRTERRLAAALLLIAGGSVLPRASAAAGAALPGAGAGAPAAEAVGRTERARAAGERSLEAITIEGVAKGPEVLFINAREPARLELKQGWRLLAAAGLDAPAPPPPRALRAAALDPIAIDLDLDSEATP